MNYKKIKIRFWFRKCQTNPLHKKGTLYGYVILNGIRSREFSTYISIEKKFWNAKQQRITNNPILQQELENLRNVILKAKQKLEFEKDNYTTNEILDLVFHRKVGNQKTFLELWQEFLQIEQQKEKWEQRTIKNNRTCYKIFTKFLQEKGLEYILPQELKKYHLQEFVIWYNKASTTTCRVINEIKRVIRYSIENEYIKESPLLFYTIKRLENIDKTHLTTKELEKIENFCSENLSLIHAKDIFLFLCYTGLNICDYLRIAKNISAYIQNDFIVVGRQKIEKKSNQKAYIPITEKSRKILEKYHYSLPTFKYPQTINELLKEIGKILGIEAKKMRTKIGRKTFAYFWLNSNIDRKAVSKMLGHAKTTTIEKYYADVDFDFVRAEINKNLFTTKLQNV